MISKTAVHKLLEIWLDENIIIYLRDMNVVAVNEAQGEVKISAMIEGYVIDIDQDYFYLGSSSGEIVKTIPHLSVGLIEIGVEASLINSEAPSSEDEVH